jgi:hypothetical protein
MRVESRPQIILTAQDINQIVRDGSGKAVEYDGGMVLVNIEDNSTFSDKMMESFLPDVDKDVLTEELISAVRSSNSDLSQGEVEEIVAVLNEKFGTGLDREDFMLKEVFSPNLKERAETVGENDNKTCQCQMTDEESEKENDSMLDSFDPSDNVKQEVAAIIARQCAVPEDEALGAADRLRQEGLLVQEDA